MSEWRLLMNFHEIFEKLWSAVILLFGPRGILRYQDTKERRSPLFFNIIPWTIIGIRSTPHFASSVPIYSNFVIRYDNVANSTTTATVDEEEWIIEKLILWWWLCSGWCHLHILYVHMGPTAASDNQYLFRRNFLWICFRRQMRSSSSVKVIIEGMWSGWNWGIYH